MGPLTTAGKYPLHVARKLRDSARRLRQTGNHRHLGRRIYVTGSKEEVERARQAVDTCFAQALLLEQVAAALEGKGKAPDLVDLQRRATKAEGRVQNLEYLVRSLQWDFHRLFPDGLKKESEADNG